MPLILLVKEDTNTNQEISDDKTEDTRESTWSSNIEQDDFDHQQFVLVLGQGCQDKL